MRRESACVGVWPQLWWLMSPQGMGRLILASFSHPSSNQAGPCLALENRGDRASGCYVHRPFKFFFFLSCPSVHLLDLEWCEKSEETQDPQIELLETTSTQEPPNPLEPFHPRDCMVPVVFPGPVSQEGCCRFTCELLKHIMYQRQQLPLPYEQLKHFYRKPFPQVGKSFGRKLVSELCGY